MHIIYSDAHYSIGMFYIAVSGSTDADYKISISVFESYQAALKNQFSL